MSDQVLKASNTANTITLRNNEDGTFSVIKGEPGIEIVGLNANGDITKFGGQIKFPATQSASSDANTLDDYEEGTWTPSVYYQNATDQSTASNSVQYGFYTKTGRVVTATFKVTFSQPTATASLALDNIGIQGLPFTSLNSTGSLGTCAVTVTSMVTPTACMFKIANSSVTPVLMSTQGDGNLARVVGTGTHTFEGTITYFV